MINYYMTAVLRKEKRTSFLVIGRMEKRVYSHININK